MTEGELRIVLILAGAIVLGLVYLFGRPRKPAQGRRSPLLRKNRERVEPTLDGAGGDETLSAEGEMFADGSESTPKASMVKPAPRSEVGRRPPSPIERVVSLHVMAREGEQIAGEDLVVAAEKAGLEYGDMGIYHRLVEGRFDKGPLFSMASMVKPGSFDLSNIGALRTPGLTFFMALPGPESALDAWDAMLPTAQRVAELLDGLLLDDSRNALGRQRIAHLRDELRAWDRARERQLIRPN